MVQARQIAYKVWISDLLNGGYHREEGEWEPNYVLMHDKKISRVNIIANVVSYNVDEGVNYAAADLDDGSGRITVRAWKDDIELLKKINVGDLILLVGRVREFNGSIYLTPEIVRNLKNLSWARLRKLELKKLYGEPIKERILSSVGNGKAIGQTLLEAVTYGTKQKILGIINSTDEISYDELILKSDLVEEEVEKVVNELIKEGEVYTPRPNYLRGI